MTARCRRGNGFTLVELAVSIAVASILAYNLSQSALTQIHGAVHMRNTLAALSIARMKMAEMRGGAYPGTGTTTLPSDPAFPGFDIQRDVTDVAASSGRTVRQVETSVTLAGGSFATPLVRLVTQVTSVATFGDGV